MKFFELLEKTLTIDYIKEFLHKKGLAIRDINDNTVSFKLYDYDWFIYYEAGRLSIYIDIDEGDNVFMKKYSIGNIINNSCWIVKCRIAERNESSKIKRYLNYYCEFICDRRGEFKKCYEFSTVALVDAIKMSDTFYDEQNPYPF